MYSKAKPRKDKDSKGRREDESEEESVRSRSGSPAGAGSKPTTRGSKKTKKKTERDSSPTVKDRSYYLKDVQVVCEKLQQGVKEVKKEVIVVDSDRSDAEQVIEMADEAASSSDRPSLMKSPAGKRRREETPDKSTDDDKLQEVSQITEGLLTLLTRDENVPKSLVEDVLRHCRKYERLLQKQLMENARLEGKVAALAEVSNKVDAACTAVHTAGERLECVQPSSVTDHRSPAAKQAPKTTYALVVKGDKKEMTASEVFKKVNKTAKTIEKEDIKIRKVRHLHSGKGVVVVTENAEDRAKVARVLNDKKGLKAAEPRELDPRIIVYDVELDMTDDDLLKGIARTLSETDTQKVKEKVKPVRRIKEDDESCNVIFDVAPDACKKLLKDSRIFCGYSSYKVAQWEEVLRCFNCHEYGHIKKNCEGEQRCWKCSGTGHLAKDCKNKEKCRNCRKNGDRSDHSVTSRDCPTYKWQLQMLRARTRRD